MDKFRTFIKNKFLVVESILYTDRTLFRKLISEAAPSDEELTKLDIELSDAENAKKYLNNEEEIELIKTYKADPDSVRGLEARNKVVMNKYPFIHLLARKMVNANRIKQEQYEDAVQNAVLSLIHAIDLYDISQNVPFTAYAKQWILAGITNPFNPVRQTSISSDALGKDKDFGLTSIDAKIDGGEDKDMTIGDTIPDRREGLNPVDNLDEKDMKARLNIFLNKLTDKEAQAIKLRFESLPDGKRRTYDEIAKELDMTKMGAKMLIDRTLNKLKQFAKEESD